MGHINVSSALLEGPSDPTTGCPEGIDFKGKAQRMRWATNALFLIRCSTPRMQLLYVATWSTARGQHLT